MFGKNKNKTVMGWRIAPPRLTAQAYGFFLLYVALPVLLVLALLDGIFYIFFRYALDRCYGLLCFL